MSKVALLMWTVALVAIGYLAAAALDEAQGMRGGYALTYDEFRAIE